MSAAPLSSAVLELPGDIVSASPGLAIDIGSMLAKVIYRSNKEYNTGRLLKCDESNARPDRVHLAMFPRENTDDVIAFIDENCDFTRDEEGVAHISATGVGGSQFKSKMEEKLKIKISILPDCHCFVKALTTLSRAVGRERMLHHVPADVTAEAERVEQATRDLHAKMRGVIGGRLFTSGLDEEEGDGREEQGSLLPCILVMAGSNTKIIMVNKDASCDVVEDVYFSGSPFLGVVTATTGERDFEKIIAMAANCDGRTATTFRSDLIVEAKDGEEMTVYNQRADDRPVFPMGKVYTAKRGDVKDGDMIQALYYVVSQDHVQIVHLQCALNKVKRAFFCGNLFENELARTTITLNNCRRNVIANNRVNMQFLRNGGMYGALGAFFDSTRVTSRRSSEETRMATVDLDTTPEKSL